MTVRRVPSPSDPSEGLPVDIPEADAAEQQVEILDETDRVDVDDADRVVALDEDEYR